MLPATDWSDGFYLNYSIPYPGEQLHDQQVTRAVLKALGPT